MIDLIQKFENYESKIADYVKTRVSAYYKSDCFKLLDRRIQDLGQSNDLKPGSLRRNEFNSHVVFPIVKERSLLRTAITSANYRSNDIFILSASGDTPPENGEQAEKVLNLNMQHTFFRVKSLKNGIKRASKFGTCVMYTYWREQAKARRATVYDPATGMYSRSEVMQNFKNSDNVEIDLRDYFQNPDVADPDESDFQGHYKRMHISELYNLLDDEQYIAENLQKAIKKAKDNAGYTSKPYFEYDEKRWGVDVIHFEGKLNLKGNEDDDTNYICEMVGDEIIKLSRDNYDQDIRSYTVINFDKRAEFWWGNPDCEYVVAHENFLNILLSMTADNALASMNQYVFFRKDTIDPADVMNRMKNRGFIPVDAGNLPLSQLVQPFQPGGLNMGAVEYAVNVVNESVQKMSTKVDLTRQTNKGQGVLQNSTATAANILAGQADVLEAEIIENFDMGVIEVGRKNLIMLQQFLEELFFVRPRPQLPEKLVRKYQILGTYDMVINSTMQKSKPNELLRLQNLLTWFINVMNTPAVSQMGINLAPIIRTIVNKADIPGADDVFSEEKALAPIIQQQIQPQALPGQPSQMPTQQSAAPGSQADQSQPAMAA
jgi:hypothetical protein